MQAQVQAKTAQTQFVQALELPPPTEANLRTSKIVNHLLYHKALVPDNDDGSRITQYIQMLEQGTDGEHVSLPVGLQRDVIIAFELVIQHHLDPWDLDLSKFSTEHFLRQHGLVVAHAKGLDIVTAGRVIRMAWEVLKLQSDAVADRAVFRSEPLSDELGWEDIPDMHFTDDQMDFSDRIIALPRAPIDEKIRHKGDRRVTLMELLSAFQEVHDEAQQRIVLNEQRTEARLALRRKMRGRLGSMMHREDFQAEMQETWERILDAPDEGPVAFSHLHEPEAMDLVQTFTSLLSLAKMGRLRLQQDQLPRDELWVHVIDRTAPPPVLATAEASA